MSQHPAPEPLLWVLVGATGCGKSAAALELAALLPPCPAASVQSSPEVGSEVSNCEIVNADALQLYRGLNIGTAKLPPQQRQGIVHHQLDVLEVWENASVAAYQRQATADLKAIARRGRWAQLVGGSGLYVSSLLYPLSFPAHDPQLREQLEKRAALVGPVSLWEELKNRQPEAARSLHPHDMKRVIRALEIAAAAPGSGGSGLRQLKPCRPAQIFNLVCEPTELRRRLSYRVGEMWRQGLVEEAEQLRLSRLPLSRTASQAIGYRQAFAQIDGLLTEAEAQEETLALTWKLAKRQSKWFARYRSAPVFTVTTVDVSSDNPRELRRVFQAALDAVF